MTVFNFKRINRLIKSCWEGKYESGETISGGSIHITGLGIREKKDT